MSILRNITVNEKIDANSFSTIEKGNINVTTTKIHANVLATDIEEL